MNRRLRRLRGWILGVFRPTHIRMARISLPALEALATRAAQPEREPAPA